MAELAAIPAPPDAVRWAASLAEAASDGPITGCVVSNELVDALPVHRLEARGGRLLEVYVALAPETEELVEEPGEPSFSRVAEYLDALPYSLARLSRRLARGGLPGGGGLDARGRGRPGRGLRADAGLWGQRATALHPRPHGRAR